MADYRLYFLEGEGHIARPPYEFAAQDDIAAILQAEAQTHQIGGAAELWCRGRRVATLRAGMDHPDM
jgi:hypothetical protein